MSICWPRSSSPFPFLLPNSVSFCFLLLSDKLDFVHQIGKWVPNLSSRFVDYECRSLASSRNALFAELDQPSHRAHHKPSINISHLLKTSPNKFVIIIKGYKATQCNSNFTLIGIDGTEKLSNDYCNTLREISGCGNVEIILS